MSSITKEAQSLLDDMLESCNREGFELKGMMIDTSDLIFEERVKMNCFYCGKYNSSWRCPPRIPDIDIKKMFSEYENAAFIYVDFSLKGQDYNTVRNDSTVALHNGLLACEKYLWNKDKSEALSFIGGSCKLCKNGCAPNKCANPYKSRSPVEALGIHVAKSIKKYGIDIKFPPTENMIRVGLLLW